MTRVIFSPKRQGETVTVEFDFISSLAAGETISAPAVTASVYTGVDASPGAILSGAAAVSGTKATQSVTAGVVGVIYQLLCVVSTSLGQVLELAGYYAIEPDLP